MWILFAKFNLATYLGRVEAATIGMRWELENAKKLIQVIHPLLNAVICISLPTLLLVFVLSVSKDTCKSLFFQIESASRMAYTRILSEVKGTG